MKAFWLELPGRSSKQSWYITTINSPEIEQKQVTAKQSKLNKSAPLKSLFGFSCGTKLLNLPFGALSFLVAEDPDPFVLRVIVGELFFCFI